MKPAILRIVTLLASLGVFVTWMTLAPKRSTALELRRLDNLSPSGTTGSSVGATSRSPSSLKVLLVSRSNGVKRMLVPMLQGMGHHVETRCTADEAVAAEGKGDNPYHVIIMDLLPSAGPNGALKAIQAINARDRGLETFATAGGELKSEADHTLKRKAFEQFYHHGLRSAAETPAAAVVVPGPAMPPLIVMLVSAGDDQERCRCLNAGASAVLAKPVVLKQLESFFNDELAELWKKRAAAKTINARFDNCPR